MDSKLHFEALKITLPRSQNYIAMVRNPHYVSHRNILPGI
jgi:hypothetical protein